MTYLIPLIVFGLGQIVKIAIKLVQRRPIALRHMLYGGMPSTHAAIVASLATVVGLREGFYSTVFGITLIFSTIVIYDAIQLRAIVGQHSAILNKLQAEGNGPSLPQIVGHSYSQVFAGVIFGIAVSLLLLVWW